MTTASSTCTDKLEALAYLVNSMDRLTSIDDIKRQFHAVLESDTTLVGGTLAAFSTYVSSTEGVYQGYSQYLLMPTGAAYISEDEAWLKAYQQQLDRLTERVDYDTDLYRIKDMYRNHKDDLKLRESLAEWKYFQFWQHREIVYGVRRDEGLIWTRVFPLTDVEDIIRKAVDDDLRVP